MFLRSYNFSRVPQASCLPRALLLITTLLLGSTAMGANAVELEKPTTQGNVSIQLPKGWTVNAAGGRSVVAALAPQIDKDATGQFQASLSISQDAGNKIDGAAQQALQVKQIPGYQILEKPAPITINGLVGETFGGSFKSGKVELRTRQYMFTLNSQIYTITFTSLNSTWATYLPFVDASVATFAVKH